eukprot:EG_transcript_10774
MSFARFRCACAQGPLIWGVSEGKWCSDFNAMDVGWHRTTQFRAGAYSRHGTLRDVPCSCGKVKECRRLRLCKGLGKQGREYFPTGKLLTAGLSPAHNHWAGGQMG